MGGTMRRVVGPVVAVCLVLVGMLVAPSVVTAQALKEQIVGTWRQVSIYNEQNGVKTSVYGSNPVGMIVFDRLGNVIQFLARPDLPKFASGNRQKGTDAENRAVVQGSVAGFGTYTVVDDKGAVAIKWVASSYPNRTGTTETRTYKIVGDEMTASNPTASSGGTSYSKYTRVK